MWEGGGRRGEGEGGRGEGEGGREKVGGGREKVGGGREVGGDQGRAETKIKSLNIERGRNKEVHRMYNTGHSNMHSHATLPW